MRGGHWRKSTNDRCRYRNYDAASCTTFWIRKCLQEEIRKTICAWTESADLILLAFKKIFLWWPSSLNIRILFKGREDSRANRQKNSGKKSAGKRIMEKQISVYCTLYMLHCNLYNIFCGANFGILLYMFLDWKENKENHSYLMV